MSKRMLLALTYRSVLTQMIPLVFLEVVSCDRCLIQRWNGTLKRKTNAPNFFVSLGTNDSKIIALEN